MKNTLLAFITFLLISACGSGSDQPAGEAETAARADSLKNAPLDIPDEVLGIAVIEPAGRIVKVAAESNGIAREVRVRVGEPVKKNEVIVLLDDELETAQIRQANAKIGAQQESVAAARADAEVLRVQLRKAQADADRNLALQQGNALTQKELDDSRAAVDNLQAQIKAKEAAIRQQQSRIAELQADATYYQTLKNKKMVLAPAAGAFLTVDIKPGEFLGENSLIGEFAPEGDIIALTEIDELFADQIQVGQKAAIRLQGRSEILTTGTVVLAPPYLRKKSLFSDGADNLEDRRVREVRVLLDDPSKVLIGARVECLIRLRSGYDGR